MIQFESHYCLCSIHGIRLSDIQKLIVKQMLGGTTCGEATERLQILMK